MEIEVNNIKINYEIFGNGNKNVILLHGNSTNTGYVKNLGKYLGKYYCNNNQMV